MKLINKSRLLVFSYFRTNCFDHRISSHSSFIESHLYSLNNDRESLSSVFSNDVGHFPSQILNVFGLSSEQSSIFASRGIRK